MNHQQCACGCRSEAPSALATGDSIGSGVPGSPASPASGLTWGAGGLSRRGVLVGTAAVAATLSLGACSGASDTGAPPAGSATPTPSDAQSTSGESPSAGGERLTPTAGIAVGGGVVVGSAVGPVVVTHPSAEEYRAFSARCPHQGCPVSSVADNTITCNCHGSTFDAATGDRLGGPAPRGLEAMDVTVEGDAVYLT